MQEDVRVRHDVLVLQPLQNLCLPSQFSEMGALIFVAVSSWYSPRLLNRYCSLYRHGIDPHFDKMFSCFNLCRILACALAPDVITSLTCSKQHSIHGLSAHSVTQGVGGVLACQRSAAAVIIRVVSRSWALGKDERELAHRVSTKRGMRAI